MSLVSLLGFFCAMVALAASPGPGTAAVVARAFSSGMVPALFLIAGMVAGDLIYLVFAVSGLSFVAETLGECFFVVKMAAAAYLVWLGIRTWQSASPMQWKSENKQDKGAKRNAFAGFLITLSNPKVILFYCGFLPTFMDLGALSAKDIVLIAVLVGVVLFCVQATYALIASRARKAVKFHGRGRFFGRLAGAVMAAAGISLAVKG